MSEIIRWLLHDAQKDLFNLLFALVLNCLFLALIGLLLWPLDQLMLALRLAQGYGVFWLVIAITTTLVGWSQQIFRVNLYNKAHTYVISNLAISGLFQAGWSAFAVLALHASMASWVTMLLYLIIMVSCFLAFLVISAFYPGQIYSLVNLPLAFISFLIFSLWPAMARVGYGWFFALF